MARILRGEIRWAHLRPPRRHERAGSSPGTAFAAVRAEVCLVLILSHDVFNERSGTVIAVILTSRPQSAGFPLTLELARSGLPKRLWVKISQIRTLAVVRIGRRVGRASDEELARVIEGLDEILGG